MILHNNFYKILLVKIFIQFISQSLAYGERYQCKIEILPENVQKNRFKTTYKCVYLIRS